MEFVTNNIFKEDTYDTPEGRRSWFNKLMGGCRFDFYRRNFWVFIKTGTVAKFGRLDAQNQVKFSTQNIVATERCGGKIHLRNLNKLRALNGKTVVFVSNHMSLLETGIVHAFIRPHVDFSFVVKESLLRVPFFGNILRAMNAVGVARKNPREDLKKVLTDGVEVLKMGRSMIIFPQSTRSENFSPEEFNSIGVKLAKSAGVPVVPMALKTNFVKTGKKFRDLGPVDINEEIYFDFGDPIEVTGNGKEAQQQVIDFIQSRLDEWCKK